jgi:hypothetical protein
MVNHFFADLGIPKMRNFATFRIAECPFWNLTDKVLCVIECFALTITRRRSEMSWRTFGVAAAITVTSIAVIVASGFGSGFAQERFDYEVRDEMFRAFGGNEAAFKNAMSKVDAKLQENPDHAEALVWRGAGRYWSAGQAFGRGDMAAAQALSAAAMLDLDRALALAPADVGVLVPRAAVLLVAARNEREPARAQDLGARAAANYETVLAIRQPAFAGLGQHNRGEYLSGLAESWALAGARDKAEGYLRRILVELANSPYAERAAAKLADWNDRRPLNCQSCCH